MSDSIVCVCLSVCVSLVFMKIINLHIFVYTKCLHVFYAVFMFVFVCVCGVCVLLHSIIRVVSVCGLCWRQ